MGLEEAIIQGCSPSAQPRSERLARILRDAGGNPPRGTGRCPRAGGIERVRIRARCRIAAWFSAYVSDRGLDTIRREANTANRVGVPAQRHRVRLRRAYDRAYTPRQPSCQMQLVRVISQYTL
jgi:hypothetical protein